MKWIFFCIFIFHTRIYRVFLAFLRHNFYFFSKKFYFSSRCSLDFFFSSSYFKINSHCNFYLFLAVFKFHFVWPRLSTLIIINNTHLLSKTSSLSHIFLWVMTNHDERTNDGKWTFKSFKIAKEVMNETRSEVFKYAKRPERAKEKKKKLKRIFFADSKFSLKKNLLPILWFFWTNLTLEQNLSFHVAAINFNFRWKKNAKKPQTIIEKGILMLQWTLLCNCHYMSVQHKPQKSRLMELDFLIWPHESPYIPTLHSIPFRDFIPSLAFQLNYWH